MLQSNFTTLSRIVVVVVAVARVCRRGDTYISEARPVNSIGTPSPCGRCAWQSCFVRFLVGGGGESRLCISDDGYEYNFLVFSKLLSLSLSLSVCLSLSFFRSLPDCGFNSHFPTEIDIIIINNNNNNNMHSNNNNNHPFKLDFQFTETDSSVNWKTDQLGLSQIWSDPGDKNGAKPTEALFVWYGLLAVILLLLFFFPSLFFFFFLTEECYASKKKKSHIHIMCI